MSTSVIDLSELDGSNGFRIDGIDAADESGRSVSGAGDVNGDGIDDLIISAPYADPDGRSTAGESYVVFGSLGGFAASLDLASLDGTNGFQIDGVDAGDYSGVSVSGTGDVNGDGIDDIVIGALGADPGGSSGAGETYVVFGSSGGFATSLDLSALDGSDGFRIDGIDENDSSGYSVSGAGDINGDGFDDIIVGARFADPDGKSESGESYVVFGSSGGFAASLGLSTLDGNNGFRIDGIDENDSSGRSVSGAGDINGDGFDDIIVGARFADPDGKSTAGESYVVFGSSGGFAASLGLSALDGNNGFRIDGIDEDDSSSVSVSGAGDINGDGVDDLIVGALGADPYGRYSAGESYVVFGSSGGFGASLDLSALDGSNGFRIDGVDAGDSSGLSVSGAGDVNGDGIDDIIIGAPGADPDGEVSAGESYLVFGSSGGFGASLDLSALNGSNGFRINGIDALDQSGTSVSGAGDVNGDGFDDIIVGARFADPDGKSNAGESYVIFGSGDSVPTIEAGQAFETPENRVEGAVIGRVMATDNDAIASYSLSGDPDGFFAIDERGVVTLTAAGAAGSANDFETGPNSFVLTVTVENPAGLRASESVNVTVSDVVPAAADDAFAIDADDTLIGDLAADNGSGTDPANAIILVQVNGAPGRPGETITLPSGALLTVNPDLTFSYDPNGAFDALAFGAMTNDTFTYATLLNTASLDLSALDGSNGFRIDGVNVGDNSGFAVSGAGDVNGDGIDDVIVGARSAAPDGKSNAGESYVVFGSPGGFSASLELAALDGSNGFRIDGIDDQDFSGSAVSGAGDVNGDGIDDIIVGAFGADPDGKSSVGESYVVFGSSEGFAASLELAALDGSNGFRIDGIDEEDQSGVPVSGAGDINGDGVDDIIVNARLADPDGKSNAGESYVVFGSSGGFAASLDLAALDGSNGFRIDGIDEGDFSGSAVSGAGDVNGDGIDDLIIGAPRADPDGRSTAGESYVVFGSSGGFAASLDLSALDGGNGFRIDGIDAGDTSGVSVSGAGDINGDGIDDLIIGAYEGDPDGKSFAGESYVVFGSPGGFSASLDLSALDGKNGFRIDGADENDFSGTSVSWAGDFNGDGIDDLIIGAPFAGPDGKLNVGESYLVFGSSGGFGASLDLAALDGSNGFRIDGIDEQDFSSRAVSGAGDVNGDGFDDIILGATGADPDGKSNAGESYIVFGRPDFATDPATVTVTITGLNGPPEGTPTITGTAEEDQVLTADASAVTDVDEIDTATTALQWQRAGVDIPGATDATYTLTQDDVGAVITVVYSYTDLLGRSENVTSDPTALVENVNDFPQGTLVLTGTVAIGETLTADASGITDEDDIVEQSITWSWFRLDQSFQTVGQIAGADQPTYTLTSDDQGFYIAPRFSYEDAFGNVGVRTSLGKYLNTPATGEVTIQGSAKIGQTITADISGIVEPDDIRTDTLSYQWRRDGVDIPGATEASYSVTGADLSAELTVHVTYLDGGRTREAFTSDATDAVTEANTLPEGSVVVIGTAEEGQVLAADASSVTDADQIDSATTALQWQRDGVDIPGATDATYTLTQDDVGAEITVVYSYTDLLGAMESVTSDPVLPVGIPQTLIGTPNPDSLVGGNGHDTIRGLEANDTLTGGAADDLLDGGPGLDTALYSGPQASHTLTLGPGTVMLADRRDGGDGTDTLIDMELLQFDGGSAFNLVKFAGPAGLAADELSSFIELYIAYFNRAPDAIGLNFWGTAFANGTGLEEMASLFAPQPETLAAYPPGTTNEAFAETVYNNVLGRTPDQSGLDFWVGQLDQDKVSRDQFILEVLKGAKSPLKPEEGQDFVDQQLADRAYLGNKVDLGAYFAVHKGMSDVDNAADAMALFDGSDASIDTAVAAIDSFHTDALDPNDGEFLMPLIGVLDDPFTVA